MKNETKEEALKNWYDWLERRLYPKPVSSNQFYIKQAMEGLYHSATSKLIQVKEEEIREKIDNILLSITPVAKFDGEKLDAWINPNSRRNVSDELVKLFLETNK